MPNRTQSLRGLVLASFQKLQVFDAIALSPSSSFFVLYVLETVDLNEFRDCSSADCFARLSDLVS